MISVRFRKVTMPDLLVRNIDPEVYERMRKTADAEGKSLAQAARETLAERYKPSRQEAWARAQRLRERIGPLEGDSTEFIREWRDNDEPHR
jgi:plasmid stability protein